jgi:hypothetical protein
MLIAETINPYAYIPVTELKKSVPEKMYIRVARKTLLA